MQDPAVPILKTYVHGEFTDVNEQDIYNLCPSTDKVISKQVETSERDAEQVLQSAFQLHQSRSWALDIEVRKALLLEAADILKGEVEYLAHLDSYNTGVPIATTRSLSQLVPLVFSGAAQHLEKTPLYTRPEKNIEIWTKPWGVSLSLAPWNAPSPIACHKLASAIAAGSPSIIKPSEFTPYSLQHIFDILAQLPFPAGSIQLIHGTSKIGAHMVKDKRVKAISFTGGLKGGIEIAKCAAEKMKPVQLELGGHNPFVILDDIEIEKVVPSLIQGMTTINGQWCRAVGQVYCPSHKKQELIDGFISAIEKLKVGPSLDESMDMGPLIHRAHKATIQQKLLEFQSHGANLHRVNLEDLGSCYLAPTLVENLPMKFDKEEVFGPVAILHSYETEEQLSEALAENEFGLASYIFGEDQEAILRLGRTLSIGSVKGNGITMTGLTPDAPRVAWGVSGLGAEGTRETIEFFQGRSVVGIVP